MTGREPEGLGFRGHSRSLLAQSLELNLFTAEGLYQGRGKAAESLGGWCCEKDWASCGLGIWQKLEGQGLKYARNSAQGNKQSQDGGQDCMNISFGNRKYQYQVVNKCLRNVDRIFQNRVICSLSFLSTLVG